METFSFEKLSKTFQEFCENFNENISNRSSWTIVACLCNDETNLPDYQDTQCIALCASAAPLGWQK